MIRSSHDETKRRIAGRQAETTVYLMSVGEPAKGKNPAIAQTIVGLGMNLTSIVTRATLREDLQHCIQRMSPQA